MKTEPTPWGALLVFGARVGVQPSAFWRLSLREWRALTATAQDETLTRGALDALAAQFPDEVR